MAMQDIGPEVAVVSTTINNEAGAYVDWPAIVAGAVIASAISFVLFAFGTAVGLSITSPYPSESVSRDHFRDRARAVDPVGVGAELSDRRLFHRTADAPTGRR